MILSLPIKKHWFEMIRSGEKKEEYRDIKAHWAVRMLHFDEEMEWQAFDEMLCDMKNPTRRHRDVAELLRYFGVRFRPFSQACLINGYKKNAPRHLACCQGITIGKGHPEWGAPPDKNVFIVRLGGIGPAR
jgi:hypothetical protein